MSDLKISIIGAGVVGLTTAIELQKQFRSSKINIVADKFNTETTSFVAAGIFRPGTSFLVANEELTRKIINDSYCYWDELRRSRNGTAAGVAELSGYIFSSQYPEIVRNHYLEKLVPVYRPVYREELTLCPGNWKYGSFFTTLLTECGIYLPWVTQEFLKAGGTITEKKVDSLEKEALECDVLVNCSGLGAKFLCADHKLVPLRGQVLKVKAPWIRTFFYGDYDTYVLPGFNSVTLGGCRQYDSYDLTINKYDGLNIKERCEALVPSLKSAKIVAQRVGLRPHRNPVRIEKERKVASNGKILNIVHNYGHGGYGVTVAPGSAIFASTLVYEILKGNSKL